MFRATSCSSSGQSIVSLQPLVCVTLCMWPFRVQVEKFLSDLHTKRPPTQSDTYQRLFWYNWFSWWWAQSCSKHLENQNKYIEKKCASSWSFTKNHNEMYGQQNIKSVVSCFKIHNLDVQAQKLSASYRHSRDLPYLHRQHTVLLLFTNQPTATPVHVHRSHGRLPFHLWTGWLPNEKPGSICSRIDTFPSLPTNWTNLQPTKPSQLEACLHAESRIRLLVTACRMW
jgi:hypothetical protein